MRWRGIIFTDLECLNVIKKSWYHYGHLGDENYVLSLMGCVHILRETTRFRVIASPSIWHSFMFQTLYSIYLCSPSTSLTSNHFSLIIQSWLTLVKAIGHYLKVDYVTKGWLKYSLLLGIQSHIHDTTLFRLFRWSLSFLYSCFLLLLEMILLYYLFLLSMKFTSPKKCRHHFWVYRSHFLTLVWILNGKRIFSFFWCSLSHNVDCW